MADEHEKSEIISAEQVANYVVCPEAWRLKYVSKQRSSERPQSQTNAKQIRKNWVEEQELSQTLRGYAKIVYLLMVLVVIVVFLMDIKRTITGKSGFSEQRTETSLEPLMHEGANNE